MRALFVGELEEDLFPLGVFEPLAVSLEELVRAALAADADEQRLLIVDSLAQLLGAGREEPAGGAFEEQEGRTRFQIRILRGELRVPLLQRRQVLFLFGGQLLKDRAARSEEHTSELQS